MSINANVSTDRKPGHRYNNVIVVDIRDLGQELYEELRPHFPIHPKLRLQAPSHCDREKMVADRQDGVLDTPATIGASAVQNAEV